MKQFTTLLLSILLFSFASCKGQGRLPMTIGEVVTKIDSNIWVVFQDKNDNYWFGSDGQGVYRYDGKTIVRYSEKDGLCNNRVREFQQDKEGNIYINTVSCISKFDGQKFTTLPVVESKEWKKQPGDMWFKGNQEANGPYRYDGQTLYHLEFPKHWMEDNFYNRFANAGYNPYQVYTIYKDSKGNLWFGTSTFGLCRYDGKTLSWMYEDHLTHIGDDGSFGIRSIMEDKDGKFWICNTQYRYTMYPETVIENGYPLVKYTKEPGMDMRMPNGNELYYGSIAKDNKQNLWMLTYYQGVWQYDGRNINHYNIMNGDKDVLLISIYKDRHGKLWLGTQNDGVYTFNGKEFVKFRP